MAQVINTNIASLTAQRNLNSTQGEMSTALNRLSSGLRINSARDDAAGLAIAERFSTQVRGLNVAARNANDGISLTQVAEGAMGEITNNLQRIRELAVQASNYTNADGDREALNNEVQELIAEIDRVARETNFNGQQLLDGDFAGALFQIGANAAQTIAISDIADARTDQIGKSVFAGGTGGVATITAATIDSLTIGDVEVVVSAEAIDTGSAEGNAKALAAAINGTMGQHGVHAEVDGAEITLTSVRAGTDAITVSGSGGGAGDFDDLVVDASAAPMTVRNINISDFLGAQQAIEIADEALNVVNSARSQMGAIQNRFESVIANVATSAENLTASRSRIQDADFAAETAALVRAQILQQSGTAMLAQANSMPQNVLALIQ